MKLLISLLAAASLAPQLANADVYITEWMYNGDEFIEFTNLGASAVDFTGWSFDDDSRNAGTVDLTAFGLVAAGESVILAESESADFIAAWNLAGVKVIGGNTTNLGRADEINLFDSMGALVDRLAYGDNSIGGPRTQNVSGNPMDGSVLGANDVTLWTLSYVGDSAGSTLSAGGFIGNPGVAPIPEPETYALMLAGLGLVGFMARRRKA